MNRRSLLILSVAVLNTALGSALAQTRIGNVILTKPVPPVHTAPFHPAAVRSAVTTTPSIPSNDSMSKADVPAGWYEVSGRISAAVGTVNLPAGSTIHVMLMDLTKPAQTLHIQFKTSHLSTPYQMVFNPARLNPSHTYAVQARVTDSSDKQLYSSDRSALLPKPGQSKSTLVNVTVR